jgi:hypothetical protein
MFVTEVASPMLEVLFVITKPLPAPALHLLTAVPGLRIPVLLTEFLSKLSMKSDAPGRIMKLENFVPRGHEPRTLWLLAIRSDQLSYETNAIGDLSPFLSVAA